MTTLEIILICVVVWLVGMVVCLWLDNDFQDLETLVAMLFWFLIVPFHLIHNAIQKQKKKKWDKKHNCEN
jgi:multisubunit Na+/H+ antiporter MnhG subunit